jgi:hypothetical protein
MVMVLEVDVHIVMEMEVGDTDNRARDGVLVGEAVGEPVASGDAVGTPPTLGVVAAAEGVCRPEPEVAVAPVPGTPDPTVGVEDVKSVDSDPCCARTATPITTSRSADEERSASVQKSPRDPCCKGWRGNQIYRSPCPAA